MFLMFDDDNDGNDDVQLNLLKKPSFGDMRVNMIQRMVDKKGGSLYLICIKYVLLSLLIV
jgi:hypothetical protein